METQRRRKITGWLIGIWLLLCGLGLTLIANVRKIPEEQIVFTKNLYGKYSGIYVMAPNGNNVKRLTSPCINRPVSPVWSPDGSLIAFGCREPDETQNLCVIGTEGEKAWRSDCKEYTALIDPRKVPKEFCKNYYLESVSWSPDGQRLAFTCPYRVLSDKYGTGALVCIITLDGDIDCWTVSSTGGAGDGVRIHGGATVDWSPTDDRLALSFALYQGVTQERVYLVDPDGRNSVFVVEGRDPSWSPDGTQIAFFRNSDGLYMIDQDGSNSQCIRKYPQHPGVDVDEILPGFTSRPSWSPDGRFVVFSGTRNPSGGNTAIYVVNLRTKGIERVTEMYDGVFSDPDWSP